MGLNTVLHEVRGKHAGYVCRLTEALSIPSISTLPEHKPDMLRMADWFCGIMQQMGLENVEAIPTTQNPMVYGDWLHAPGKPTVLVYGHYDVQPVDPLEEWVSAPFTPETRGDYMYARGASDMKGQIFAQLMAVEALLAGNACPVNLKYLIEGDEERGSPCLRAFLEEHRERLGCDVVLNCDATIHGSDTPSITYALRGLAYFEVEVSGPETDLHSGVFGGAIHNPIHVLCELLAGLHDGDGRITLPGFYAHVRAMDDEERRLLAAGPYSDDAFLKTCGARALHGEKGFSTVERIGARPSLDVNGIWGGFQGEGAKTVLPARAGAKLSMRLVPDQRLDEVEGQLRAWFEAKVPDGCGWSVTRHSLGPGAVMDRDSSYMKAAVSALKTVFGKSPFFRREGASVPVAGLLQELLGVDTVMLGFGLPDDGIHGPNERQSLPLLFKGIECYLHFLALAGARAGG